MIFRNFLTVFYKGFVKYLAVINKAEYHVKNYGDRGGCYTLRDLHNSSDDAKAEFNNCFIIIP